MQQQQQHNKAQHNQSLRSWLVLTNCQTAGSCMPAAARFGCYTKETSPVWGAVFASTLQLHHQLQPTQHSAP
jgi:hypothetical protein